MRFAMFLLLVAAGAASGPLALSARGAPAPRLIDRLEASVDASAILSSDIRRFRATASLRSRLDPLFATSSLAAKGAGASDSEVLDGLIADQLILNAFPVSDADVEQEIRAIQSGQRISRERLREELKRNGFGFDDYFELIRLSTAKRNLIDREIRSKVTITDDDVKSYYYSHGSRSEKASLSYRVKILSFSRSNYKSARAVQEAADRAEVALRSGDSFEDVARRFGDDTAQGAEDVGPLTEEQMSPQIRSQIKKLKVGGVSPVFGDASTRLFILKLSDISAGDDSRLAAVREEIRNRLAAEEYEHQIRLWLDRQEQRASIHRAASP